MAKAHIQSALGSAIKRQGLLGRFNPNSRSRYIAVAGICDCVNREDACQ